MSMTCLRSSWWNSVHAFFGSMCLAFMRRYVAVHREHFSESRPFLIGRARLDTDDGEYRGAAV